MGNSVNCVLSFWLQVCLGLALLAPSLTHAQSFLETPANGDKLSGIGVIRGWKCEAVGDITVRFNADEAQTYTMVYGSDRPDTKDKADGTPLCGDTNNGFVALFNWGILGNGTHTAVAYDNGVEFGRSTFSVTTAGKVFLPDASETPVVVPDFPGPGQTTTFQWNRGTQHLEMVMWKPGEISYLGPCVEGLTVGPGAEMCHAYLTIAGSDITYFFSVDSDGRVCISKTGDTAIDGCHAGSLPPALVALGVAATKNTDGSWTIDSLPSSGPADLGTCRVGLTVNPGALCRAIVRSYHYTFSVEPGGNACITGLGLLDGCHHSSDILNAVMAITWADFTRNADNSWTINRLPD